MIAHKHAIIAHDQAVVAPSPRDLLGAPRWVTESEVVAEISLRDAIEAVRGCYVRAGANVIRPLPKTVASWDGGTLHAVGAVAADSGLAVVKTWCHTARGATPLLVAWRTADGQLVAVIEAFALGQLRTSAVTGVATAALANERGDTVAVIGTGKQAAGQVAAVAAVRDIGSIRVFSPTSEHRHAFADRLAARSGIPTAPVPSLEEAVSGASIVITATRARQPFLTREMLTEGAHVNAIGAITPERAELDESLVRAARRVVADDVAAARVMAPRELSVDNAPHVLSLAYVLSSGVGRPSTEALTVFKAVGSGVSDLALAELVVNQIRSERLGRTLQPPGRVVPELWSDQ